jgi:hypothetical protein
MFGQDQNRVEERAADGQHCSPASGPLIGRNQPGRRAVSEAAIAGSRQER